jgi:hypothetical protein
MGPGLCTSPTSCTLDLALSCSDWARDTALLDRYLDLTDLVSRCQQSHVADMDRLDYQIYEDSLVMEGVGFPLWHADPGSDTPPEIGSLGYFE